MHGSVRKFLLVAVTGCVLSFAGALLMACGGTASRESVAASAGSQTATDPYVPQRQYTAADQRTARAVVLKKADLPDLGGPWRGGFVAPGVEGDPCLGAIQSDLVLTGAAETEFDSDYAYIDSNLWVLKTAKMVRLDASRQPTAKVENRCTRAIYEGDDSIEVRSIAKLPFPAFGVKTIATRVTYEVQEAEDPIEVLGAEGASRQIDDWITVFIGRFEISLAVSTNLTNKAIADSFERSLMKLLVRRVTPVRLVGYSFGFDPDTLVAGAPFALTGFQVRPDRVGDLDNTGPVWSAATPDSIRCTASIGGAVLPASGQCRWKIPADAKGKTLKLVVNATYKGAKGRFTLALPIGGRT